MDDFKRMVSEGKKKNKQLKKEVCVLKKDQSNHVK